MTVRPSWYAVVAIAVLAVSAGSQVAAQAAVTDPAKKPVVKKKPAPKSPTIRRYRSSSGKPAPGKSTAKSGATKSTKSSTAKTTTTSFSAQGAAVQMASARLAQEAPAPLSTTSYKPAPKTTRRRFFPRPSPVSAKTRIEANEGVFEKVSRGADLPVENAARLIPFFELLYRHQKGEIPGPLRILHYGDSHTAADDWTGDMRTHFQEKFGDGGSGYSFAGRPWSGYRRLDVRTGSTRGWHTDGLVGKPGDGVYGLGGVSMSTHSPREGVYLMAECQQFEVFYLQQPGGGALELYDNGAPVERIETAGELAPGYYHYETVPGPHKFELETLEHAPVRLFGWVAENTTGVTYETLGINGAQASIALGWDEATLRSNVERRNPGLIVLAYGTNEAGQKGWTIESYRETFLRLIARFREAAPTATILVIGPPDRFVHTRKGWVELDKLDLIVEAQRQAAVASGCAFWDMRAKMGGAGSMRQWVQAGMAQYDYVHFTGPGYRMLGDAIFRDVMSQYDVFLKARDSIADAAQ
jgi:lysophospholipase L1-like esterase